MKYFKYKFSGLLLVLFLCSLLVPMKVSAAECTEHLWSEWSYTIEPSCFINGQERRYCLICFTSETRETAAYNAHDWDDWEIEIEATCCEDGIKTRTCSRCYESEDATIPATGKHDWSDWETGAKSTLYAAGWKIRYCNECYEEEYKKTEKLKMPAKGKDAAKVITQYLNAEKKYNVQKMSSMYQKKPKNYFFEQESYLKTLAKKNHAKKFTFRLARVKMSGKKVVVSADITYPNAYDMYYHSAYDFYNWALKEVLKRKNPSQDTLNNKLLQTFKKNTKKYKIQTQDASVSFTLKKQGKNWKIIKTSSNVKDISNMNCNKAAKDAEKQFKKDYWYYF